ncbi:MAG: M48 family metallopeptidase [Planctomycetota bacterium]|nr:M48 family metallopeptidase [Planctomycetota bacterium]
MTRRLAVPMTLLLAAVVAIVPACVSVSGTSRSQLNAYSIEQEIRLGDEAYAEMLQAVDLVDSGPDHDLVVEVTERIAAAAERLHPGIAGRFDWEVVLVDDDDIVNAWALPGGKMAVYTGILPYTKTPDGLAAVLGHEAAHAIARHGGENLTRQGLVNLLAIGTAAALDADDRHLVAAAATAYGLLGEPAYSRSQESEADELGVFIAADAGYDPREAVGLWQRMAERGGEPPEFLSTHPSSETRVRELERLMPAALEIRRRRLQLEATEAGGS